MAGVKSGHWSVIRGLKVAPAKEFRWWKVCSEDPQQGGFFVEGKKARRHMQFATQGPGGGIHSPSPT
ncbi:hypothetical protein CCM_02508 [Cordyceps militaris CM01]|uniref:Uncharacterized protein n=1 Tax=Cordyceps militaris (strain CM01) TaxID=983644 RepID=G3JA67_CORMM|nr:uncharacterized protein CCM_02508 [Cordyceps militaris CM01]EGX94237.1 hypothetical protein CCM_02508 [Cordyceps militaris CM01]